jgi:hypothetical protein
MGKAMTSKPKDWIVAVGMIAILALFYGTVAVFAADLKVGTTRVMSGVLTKKPNQEVSAWICGYSAGFEDGIRKLDDPRQPESPQCDKFRSQAKSVLK